MIVNVVEMAQSALSNQVVAGGAALGAMGAGLAYIRNVPKLLFGWGVRQATVTVDVVSADPAFAWLSAWLDSVPYSKKARRLSASTRRNDYTEGEDNRDVLFTPAPGLHYFRHKGRFVQLSRSRSENPPPASGMGGQAKPNETIHITVLGRSQSPAREIIDEAREHYRRVTAKQAKLWVSSYGHWTSIGYVRERPLDTVILPVGEAERLIDDLDQFLKSKEWYRTLGIPYRRGYLLHGVPGAGKSSLVNAIAGHFGLDLYSLNLGSSSINDDRLLELLNGIEDKSMVLFEDIDAAVRARTLQKTIKAPKTDEDDDDEEVENSSGGGSSVTLSGFLNVLDGVAARESCVVFMTTNHPELLDPAVIRPGRIDTQLYFGYAEPYQIERMFKRFYENDRADAFVHAVAGRQVSMAALQQHFLKYRNDSKAALENIAELGSNG